jgi:hypothetical protein
MKRDLADGFGFEILFLNPGFFIHGEDSFSDAVIGDFFQNQELDTGNIQPTDFGDGSSH